MTVRIQNLINELHHKTARFLVDNFDVILLPDFKTSGMVTRSQRRIRSKTVRNLLSFAHHRFRNFLRHKASENGRTVLIVNEAYTSKTVSWTGEINHKLGGRKTVTSSDGRRMDRDHNGARGIFLRALGDTLSLRQHVSGASQQTSAFVSELVSERLYNIHYLLRRGRGSNRVVEALVDFMSCFYSRAEMWDLIQQSIDWIHDFSGMSQRATAYFATAMSDEALRLEVLGQVDEALEVYGDILRRLDPDDGPEAERLVARLLSKKAYLFNIYGRGSEAAAACEDLIHRFATSEDPTIRRIVASSGIIKGMAFIKNKRIEEAVSAFDQVVVQYESAASPDVFDFALLALVAKSTHVKLAISEREISILLKCQERKDELHWGVIEVLTQFSASAGTKRTLELIQGSEAAPLLLPLVTALQQELGQVTHVAKEVDAVAGDVRGQLARQAIGDAQGWLCRNCRKDISGKGEAQLDHIVPVSNGGANEFETPTALPPMQSQQRREGTRAKTRRFHGAGDNLRSRHPAGEADCLYPPLRVATGDQINVVNSAPWLLLCTWSASPMPCNNKNRYGPWVPFRPYTLGRCSFKSRTWTVRPRNEA